jgi:hypothetical protein
VYRKMLIVGLGGSGGKTLRFLKRDLRRWLSQPSRANPDAFWTSGIPEGWQFLHIDTPAIADGLTAGGDALEDREYLGLVGTGVSLESVMNRIDNVPDVQSDLTSWRVDPYRTKVPLQVGAGQFRAVGRSVGLAYSDTIREHLQASIGRLRDSEAQPQLDRLYEHVHGESANGGSADPIAIVVSSLAGGTGAGLLVDVLDILYNVHPAFKENTLGLYYTPDAFSSDADQGGLSPNSLGAISEVLNGAWWNGTGAADNTPLEELLDDVPGKRSRITNQIAKIVTPLHSSGAYCNFLIGGTNAAGNDVPMDSGLFAMVGGALLSWVTDVKVQEEFVAYEIANWQSSALNNMPKPGENSDLLVNMGPMGESGPPAFSALGFARVSVGTDYLRRYAAQMIAKDAATHLLKAHEQGQRAQEIKEQGVVSPDRIVELLVADQRDRFVRCMDVYGRHDADRVPVFSITERVMQDLVPADAERAYGEQLDRIMREVSAVSANAAGWARALEPLLQDARAELELQARRGLPRAADAWVRQATDVITRAVEKEAGDHGIRVARGLVMDLRLRIMDPNEGAVVALANDAATQRSYTSMQAMVGYVEQELRNQIGDGKVSLANVKVGEVIRGAMNYAYSIVKAEIAERAELLLKAFATGYLTPVEKALADGYSTLGSNDRVLARFPDFGPGTPPAGLLPPRSEFTVIEPRDFYDQFQVLLRDTYTEQSLAGMGALDARADVRNDVASGASVRKQLAGALGALAATRELRELTLLDFESEWRPGYEVLGGSVAAQAARVKARVAPEEIEERADHWLGRRGFPFQQFLDQDLRSYTRSPDGTQDDVAPFPERQAAVLAKIDQAVAAAAPLIRIDGTLLPQVHPDMGEGSDGYRITLSTLPFRLHPLEERITERMLSTVYSDSSRKTQFENTLTQDADLSYIDVISTLKSPVYPWVVPSLMIPIAQEWNEGNTQNPVFWSLRRARPVREFIPAPQAHIRAMLRGWFTAEALGLLSFNGTRTSIVHSPAGDSPKKVSFPHPPLEPAQDDDGWDRVVTLLESLATVMPEVARTQQLTPFRPYNALRDLGMSDPEKGAVLKYSTLNPVLRVWIEEGRVESQEVTGSAPLPELARLTTATERMDALVARFEGLRVDLERDHKEYLRATRENRSLLSEPPLWPGLYGEISIALQSLVRAIRRHAARSR